MSLGLVGIKRGMTRVFTETGESVPVTVIEVSPNRVTQIKNSDTDGYCAIQISTGSKKPSRVTKAQAGHFTKANVDAGDRVCEFRLSEKELDGIKLGDAFDVDVFKAGQYIDVQGISKGKGFQGVIKRHNFTMQDATHGNSLSHRAHGSTGQRQTPGRVFKGKKMAGQMGNVTRTAVNQIIVQVNKELNCILVKGGVPGAPGRYVILKVSSKKTKQ